MAQTLTALARAELSASALAAAFPPKWMCANKKFLAELAYPRGSTHGGTIKVSRWPEAAVPASFPVASRMTLQMREDVFDYKPAKELTDAISPTRPVIEWHLNFADTHLFGFYGGTLFAQDEMQVMEHPDCASLMEVMQLFRARKNIPAGVVLSVTNPDALAPLTRSDHRATPVLVAGVERRLSIDTGMIGGISLYGHGFAHASQNLVRDRTVVCHPPTISNIIAIAAPSPNRGRYTQSQILNVLHTTYTGFVAAVTESRTLAASALAASASSSAGSSASSAGSSASSSSSSSPPSSEEPPLVVIHTGNLGCGAFGGNIVLMSALQVLAAQLAGVDVLVYHSVSAPSTAGYEQGVLLLKTILDVAAAGADTVKLSDVAAQIEAQGLLWGVSNGT